MPFKDPETGKQRKYSVKELKEAAKRMRAYVLVSTCAAGSGHPGGSLSAADLVAAAFLNHLNHDPKNPRWPERDRFFLSKAHIVPVFYAAFAEAGYYPVEEMMTLRKVGSRFQGHSDWIKMKEMEMSGGSLGQGLSIAVGAALAARLDGKKHRIFCMMGDGEQQEGNIWEAAMSAGNFKVDNLTAIVDKNRLQIDGLVKDVMNIDPLGEKYKAFGWHVIEINGHNMEQILAAYQEADSVKGKPTVIIANTVKGKGASFMENVAGWHGKAPNREQMLQGLKDLGMENLPYEDYFKYAQEFHKKKTAEIDAAMPKFKKDYWWNSQQKMKAEMVPTRKGWGRALNEIGNDSRIVTIHADISGSITIDQFEKDHPERLKRVFSVGIAEQNMTNVAAGFAKEGKIPVIGTYGVFASGRPWDQLRTTVCYGNLNVKIGGAHGGISVGPDGATHQSLEEIAVMGILPNMHLYVPCDSVETNKITKKSTLDVLGPCYVRFAREATPVVTTDKTPCKLGKANVIRYRGEKENFIDAFETTLAENYKNEQEQFAIIACGPMLPEAMRAAWILKEEYGVETRVLNVHTVKPLDRDAISKAAEEVGKIITVEEHQVGGFGNIVAEAIAEHDKLDKNFRFAMIGVQDRFGESGQPWELVRLFGLTAEHIAAKAVQMLGK